MHLWAFLASARMRLATPSVTWEPLRLLEWPAPNDRFEPLILKLFSHIRSKLGVGIGSYKDFVEAFCFEYKCRKFLFLQGTHERIRVFCVLHRPSLKYEATSAV